MSDTALSRAEMTVKVIAQTAVDNETYFCELDAVVGDGDFGYSLARGFEIVLSDFDELEYDDAGGLLEEDRARPHQAHRRHVGADLGDRLPARRRRAVGQRRAQRRRRRRRAARLDRGDQAAREHRPRATRRCSTRSSPRSTSSRQALQEGAPDALQRAAVKARESAEATKGMLAQRGRASYTGERSRDSVDAGAIGIAVMLEAVSKAWQESELERA